MALIKLANVTTPRRYNQLSTIMEDTVVCWVLVVKKKLKYFYNKNREKEQGAEKKPSKIFLKKHIWNQSDVKIGGKQIIVDGKLNIFLKNL